MYATLIVLLAIVAVAMGFAPSAGRIARKVSDAKDTPSTKETNV